MIGGSLGGAITSPIIFAIGSTGAAKFKADMMISAGAVALVAKSLYDTQKAAEDFSVKMNALTTEQRKVALAMDASAKGIVDTGATFEITSKLIEAGVKPTREFADAFGKTIGEAAARFNWSMDEATEKAKKLAEGIAKGSTRTLKEFGIDLENSEDQVLAQAEAIDKLIARSKDLDFELQTARQRWDAMSNSYSTAQGYIYDLAANMPVVSDALSAMNKNLSAATKGFEDIKTAIEGTDYTVFDLAVARWNDEIRKFLKLIPFVGKSLADNLGGSDELMGKIVEQKQGQQLGEWFGEEWQEPETSYWAEAGSNLSKEEQAKFGIYKTKEKKGGGGGRKAAEEMKFTLDEVETAWMDIFMIEDKVVQLDLRREKSLQDQADILGDQVLGMTEDLFLKDEEIWEKELTKQREDEEYQRRKSDWMEAHAEANEVIWQRELDRELQQKKLEEERHIWRMQAQGEEATRRVTDLEEWLGIEQEALDRSRDQWVSGVQGKMQLLGGMLSGWSALMNSENRKAFEIGKVAAISETVINGIAGSIAAYKAMAGIPYVGPALGAVAAAGVIAASIAAVAKIKAQKFGGGAASSTGISSAAGSIGSGTGASSMSGAGGGGEQSINVNVTVPLDGEVIYENQQKHNWNAARDGRPAFGWAAA